MLIRTANIFNRSLLPVWLLLVVVALIDLTGRVWIEDESKEDTWRVKPLNVTTDWRPSTTEIEPLKALLSAYEQAVEEEQSVEAGMALELQKSQQGDLAQLFDGEARYRLAGIFNHNDLFGVLSHYDFSSKETNVMKVKLGDVIGAYKVAAISNDAVKFTSVDSREITLFLYKKFEKEQ